jgi:hypothetical protein
MQPLQPVLLKICLLKSIKRTLSVVEGRIAGALSRSCRRQEHLVRYPQRTVFKQNAVDTPDA